MGKIAKIWRNCIIAETKTFAEVPNAWKEDVKALLREDVLNGVITSAKYEEYIGEPFTG